MGVSVGITSLLLFIKGISLLPAGFVYQPEQLSWPRWHQLSLLEIPAGQGMLLTNSNAGKSSQITAFFSPEFRTMEVEPDERSNTLCWLQYVGFFDEECHTEGLLKCFAWVTVLCKSSEQPDPKLQSSNLLAFQAVCVGHIFCFTAFPTSAP